MKQLTINPSNKPYYSEDFIKGFECGTQRQLEADLADKPQGEWINFFAGKDDEWLRSDGIPMFLVCNKCHGIVMSSASARWDFCPNCGSRMKGREQ